MRVLPILYLTLTKKVNECLQTCYNNYNYSFKGHEILIILRMANECWGCINYCDWHYMCTKFRTLGTTTKWMPSSVVFCLLWMLSSLSACINYICLSCGPVLTVSLVWVSVPPKFLAMKTSKIQMMLMFCAFLYRLRKSLLSAVVPTALPYTFDSISLTGFSWVFAHWRCLP